MLLVAVKASVGFGVILTMMGTLQSQTLTDMMVAFLAAGMLPGTHIQIPAELSLIGVAGALMLLVAWLLNAYMADRRRLQLASQEYPNFSEDPGYELLVPGLRRVMQARRSAEAKASDASLNLYVWLRSLGRPVIAQAIAVRKGLSASFVRFDALAAGRAELYALAENAASAIRAGVSYGLKTWAQVSEKARQYLVRFILS